MDTAATVRIVADGLVAGETEAEIVRKLIAAGVPSAQAPGTFAAIKAACQQGVQSVVTDGASSPGGPPSDPLLAEAFRVGEERMRGATRGVWSGRLLKIALVLLGVGALIAMLRR